MVVVTVIAGIGGRVSPDSDLHTIRKDCPSGAVANVSHNIPVRMLLGSLVVVTTAIVVIGSTVTSDGSLHTIRKDCPSGAAAKVSHNRLVRMSQEQGVRLGLGMAGHRRCQSVGIRGFRGSAGANYTAPVRADLLPS